jgi:hypothetical protein
VLALRVQHAFLLGASYFFYASWDWRFLSMILLSTAVDFVCGQQIHAAADCVDPHLTRGG